MKWYIFAIGAFLSWGAYGPALHKGGDGFVDQDRTFRTLRSLVCVGFSYFFVAILIPGGVLAAKGALAGFTVKGSTFSLLAGALGAIGAICIAWAFRSGGSPIYVMPLVFAGAPVMNAFISMATHPPAGGLAAIDFRFYLGLLFAAGGTYMVLAFKPS